MSLKSFHIVFVTLSSLLSFVFSGWALHVYRATRDGSYLTLSIGALLFGLLLIAYGFWFWHKIKTREEQDRDRRKTIHTIGVACALLWLFSAEPASACTVCYGEAEGPMIDAARMGVYLLFGLVLAIQLSFASFFVYLWRRARRLRRNEIHS